MGMFLALLGSKSKSNAKKTLAYMSRTYPAVRSIWSGWSVYTRAAGVELLWLAAFDAILAPNCGCGATTRESAYQDFDYRHNTAHVAMSSWRARTAASSWFS